MKIVPIDIIKSMSGKVCSHSDTYVSLNSTSGKMFTGKICHPYEGPLSQNQLAQQSAFAARTALVTTWLNANKPSASNGDKGTALYQQAQRLKKQLQLSNVRQVVCKYMDAQGKVTLPAITVTTSGSTGGSTGGSGGSDI